MNHYSRPTIGFNFKDVPLDDPAVFHIFSEGDTVGVFQLETQLGQQWAKKVKPKSIKDVAALVSILRPGPLESGMSDQFARRKNGEEEVDYYHQALEPILRDTYGCLIYQEQVIRICTDIAGFTEVEADLARKAVGKKLPEEMAKVKKMFIEGCKKQGIVNEEQADEIFGWIEKSVRYSFNASHGVSYAYIAYLTAYQKYYFPTEFYVSWLNFSDQKPNPREEIYKLVQDARFHKVEVNPPSVLDKSVEFKKVSNGKISFGLAYIRGVGEKASAIIQKLDLSTFTKFIKNVKRIKRNVAESLIKSGACDHYGYTRSFMIRCLYAYYGQSNNEKYIRYAEVKSLTNKELEHVYKVIDEKGIIGSLRSIIENKACVSRRESIIESKIEYIEKGQKLKDTNRQNSIWEKLYLGLSITCSAADDYEKRDPNIKTCEEANRAEVGDSIVMHVVVDGIRRRTTSKKAKTPDQPYCYMSVSDNTGALENLVCWPNVYIGVQDDLREDLVVTIYGKKESWRDREQIIVNNIMLIG